MRAANKSKWWDILTPTSDELARACHDIASRKKDPNDPYAVNEAEQEQVWWDAGGDISDEIARQVTANRSGNKA